MPGVPLAQTRNPPTLSGWGTYLGGNYFDLFLTRHAENTRIAMIRFIRFETIHQFRD